MKKIQEASLSCEKHLFLALCIVTVDLHGSYSCESNKALSNLFTYFYIKCYIM